MKVKDIVHQCYYDTPIELYDCNNGKRLLITNNDDGEPIPQKYMEMDVNYLDTLNDYLVIAIYIKD